MDRIIPIVYVRTIFGRIPILDNFWTEIYTTSRTLDGLERYFSETGTTIWRYYPGWADLIFNIDSDVQAHS